MGGELAVGELLVLLADGHMEQSGLVRPLVEGSIVHESAGSLWPLVHESAGPLWPLVLCHVTLKLLQPVKARTTGVAGKWPLLGVRGSRYWIRPISKFTLLYSPRSFELVVMMMMMRMTIVVTKQSQLRMTDSN